MARYKIWNKIDDVFTPSGEKFTAQQWIERYPIAEIPTVKVVCGGGALNGAFFGILDEMVEMYAKVGCDFSGAESDQDKLDAIEAFEDERNKPDTTPTSEERIASALEFQNMMM